MPKVHADKQPAAEEARPSGRDLTLPPIASPAGGLVVGAADHRAEREADRMAEQVVRRLTQPAGTEGADGAEPAAIPTTGRIQRSTTGPSAAAAGTVGPEGGVLDGSTSAAIGRVRASGAPLGDDVRRRMEDGFGGADFGRVRLHTGREATRLNDAMQAQAFTVGSDIFVHDRAPRPDTAAGTALLAHELTHTVQAGAGAQRMVHRRLWDAKEFEKQTKEGVLVRASTAQKAIVKKLDEFHTKYPPAKLYQLDASGTDDALNMLAELRGMAQAWIGRHTIDDFDGEIRDGSRENRRAGMDGFIAAVEGEMRMLLHFRDTRTKGSADVHDLGAITVTNPSPEYSKVIAHYGEDLTSVFRKIGGIIDTAVPLDGDTTSIEISVKIPIPPGYVGFELSISAERDGEHIEVSLDAGVTGGASVDVASIGAALGGYISAKAKTGADVAELLSYGLFRRSRQSNLIPREVENFLWGGQGGAFGWAQAEKWSLGVESRIFGGDDEAEVTTGAYGKVEAEVELSDIAGLEFSATGKLGTKINKDSLEKRKGGAGQRNLRSGAAPDSKNYDKASSRGAQKSVGVGVGGLELSAGGKFGPFSGEFTLGLGWASDGAHGKKSVSLDTFEIGGAASFTMPMNELVGGGIGQFIPELIKALNRLIRAGAAKSSEKSGGAAVGVDQVAGAATMIGELANVPREAWSPFAASPDVAGTSFTHESKLTLAIDFDFMTKELSISINQSKGLGVAEKILDTAGGVSDVFSFELERTSRLLQLKWKGGTWQGFA